LEMFSYVRELKRFRPLLRVNHFVKCKPERSFRRKLVIRDWMHMVLWYVRLRKANKG